MFWYPNIALHQVFQHLQIKIYIIHWVLKSTIIKLFEFKGLHPKIFCLRMLVYLELWIKLKWGSFTILAGLKFLYWFQGRTRGSKRFFCQKKVRRRICLKNIFSELLSGQNSLDPLWWTAIWILNTFEFRPPLSKFTAHCETQFRCV